MTSCRLQSNYSFTVTLHGGPVALRPVRATPFLFIYFSFIYFFYRMAQKRNHWHCEPKSATIFLPVTSLNSDQFKNIYKNKFVIKTSLKLSPHLRWVAAPSCKNFDTVFLNSGQWPVSALPYSILHDVLSRHLPWMVVIMFEYGGKESLTSSNILIQVKGQGHEVTKRSLIRTTRPCIVVSISGNSDPVDQI